MTDVIAVTKGLIVHKEILQMKKSYRAKGVTLLEIMLVLAVAAMVIIMSIRYYRNASNSANANSMLNQINAIMSAADQIAQGQNGSYASIATAGVSGIVGANNMNTPYGTAYTVAGASTTTYTITWAATVPAAVCNQVAASVVSNPKVTVQAACGTNGVATLLFTSTS